MSYAVKEIFLTLQGEGVHAGRRHRGADDVQAVQRGLGGNACDVAREGEGVLTNGQLEVLGHCARRCDLRLNWPV